MIRDSPWPASFAAPFIDDRQATSDAELSFVPKRNT
jgi:hypothetical protein